MSSPAFQFYPAEFLSDENVTLMTNRQLGCYIKLLCFCWREGSIPSDINKIAKLCGEESTPIAEPSFLDGSAIVLPSKKNGSAMDELWIGIKSCFVIDQNNPSRLLSPRLDKEREKQELFKKERSTAGKKGAASKWSNRSRTDDLSITEPSKKNGSAIVLPLAEPMAEPMAKDGSSSLSLSLSSSSSSKSSSSFIADDDWNFNVQHYEKIGFTEREREYLRKLGNLNAHDVEQSLIEFMYDLENNKLPKIKTSQLNYLIGLLKSGKKYSSENYRKGQDEAIVEMARRTKAKQEELLESKFILWESSLNEEERKSIIENVLPSHLLVLYLTHGSSNSKVKKWLFDKYSAGDFG